MIVHILKRDLKRKKTMNTILFLFIIIASMFMASSIPNIITVMNGTNYFLDKAGVGDYLVVNMGTSSTQEMEKILKESTLYEYYTEEEVIFTSDGVITRNGKEIKSGSTNFIQCVEKMEYRLYTDKGDEIAPLPKGEFMITKSWALENNMKVGDVYTIEYNGAKLEMTYVGYFKDAVFGSQMMGNMRVLMSQEDYETFKAVEVNRTKWLGHIYHIYTKDVSGFKSEISKVSGLLFDGAKSMVSMCYVMEMIVSAIVLVMGVVLIVISFVVLKFMVNFSISEEFREIGVMKAIGIKNSKIRSLYVVKYVAFAVVGSFIGLLLSVPFGKFLLNVATNNLLLDETVSLWVNVLGAVGVILITALYAYRCTGIIKKSTPIDAIRNGQTGERYKKKKGYRIGSSHLKPSGYMALNDIKSSPKRFLTIIVAFTLCCLLTLVIGNTTATMKSGKLCHLFGSAESDLYYGGWTKSAENIIANEYTNLDDTLEELRGKLKDLGYDCRVFVERQYKYGLISKGKEYNLTFEQGVGVKASEYRYTKGTAPAAADEIAITKIAADVIDAKIGDKITIQTSEGPKEMLITAYFEVMNNLGELVRFHEDFKGDAAHGSGLFMAQIKFLDDPDDKELKKRVKVLEENGIEKLLTEAEYSRDMIGVVDTMSTLEMSLLGVMVIVVIFTTILMESSFISNEKSQIAMLKALGFQQRAILAWHVKRFGAVSLISVGLSIILSIPVTRLTITPIFRMMGAETIDFTFDYLKAFVLYPLLVLAVTVLFTCITALKTRSIQASDTANIE